MSWITVIWSMTAGACLTLAGLYAYIWFKLKGRRAYALFLSSALAAAATSGFEAALMRAMTVEQFVDLMRWGHVPFAVLTISVVWFLRFYLSAGRLWLAWLVCSLRVFALIFHIVFEPIFYEGITTFRQIQFLGEPVSVAVESSSPRLLIGNLSTLLLLLFCVDATLTAWRRGNRHAAVVVGGGAVFFVSLLMLQTFFVQRGIINTPFFFSLAFVGLVLAMGLELGSDVAGAARLGAALERSESELRTSHEQMNLAAAAACLGLWRWDFPEDDVWASRDLHLLLGFAGDERITSTTFLAHVHPDDRHQVESALHHAIETGADYTSEYRVALPDGNQRWIAARGRTQARGADGAVRILGVCIDITERKRAQMEMVRQGAELAHFDRIVTIGELTAALAHELRQPIGAILRNTEAAGLLLQDDAPDVEELREIIEDIHKDDQRAAAVIDRTRAMLLHSEAVFAILEVNELLAEAEALIGAEAARRKVRVHVNLSPAMPRVHGDRVQLQQVLINLMMNAMDSMDDLPTEQRRLLVQVRGDGGDDVEIAVSDSGPGIPAGQLAQVFEPFFTTKTDGLGLGLAISRSIVETHGGRLRAENTAAGGAMFCFTVPAAAKGKSS